MAVPISNVTRRVVYAASGTGPYAFTFEILANTDIAVYKDDALLTLTTDYTVTIASNGTGSITLVASPTGATQIAIVGNRTIQRTTDFVTGGDFFANTVNDEMDQQTIFAQQNAEGLQRALSAPQTDPTTINMTLPRASLRANKALGFDANGNPAIADTLGTNRGNWAATTVYYVRDIVKDTTNNNIWQCITAHTSSGSQPISTNTDSAKWTLLVDAASATASAAAADSSADDAAASAILANDWATKTSGAVAGGEYSAKYHAQAASTSASNASTSASNASTSASNAASAQTAAEAARDATLAAYDSFDDRYLGAKTSAPTVDNDGNTLLTGAIYWNSTSSTLWVWTGSVWSQATLTAGSFATLAGTETLTNKTLADPKITIGGSNGTSGQVLTSAGAGAAPTWSSIAGGDATNNIGYLNIPQNSQSAAYTLVLSDAGKHIYHPSTDANARTFTIPANASVAYPVGTAITFANMSAQAVTIAITSDTLYLAGAGTTGSRSLAQYGTATALKLTSTTWIISGAGLT